jgi:HPt (histidine-containing phosphotransfer) domain-containing protein
MPDVPSSEAGPVLYSNEDIEHRIRKAQKQVNLDNEDMKDIICQYIQDTPVMLDNLVSAWHRKDFESIALYAHSLVGVTRLLYFDDVSECASIIEELAKENFRAKETILLKLQKHHNAGLAVLRQMYPCPELLDTF